jgi:hypothetical protein
VIVLKVAEDVAVGKPMDFIVKGRTYCVICTLQQNYGWKGVEVVK